MIEERELAESEKEIRDFFKKQSEIQQESRQKQRIKDKEVILYLQEISKSPNSLYNRVNRKNINNVK